VVETLGAFNQRPNRFAAPAREQPVFARTRRLESTDSVDKPGLLAAATTNRIKGLLFFQGASGYEPLRRDR